jgi:hydrophobe/amphiphile efflux-1 (HAE1) family protein
MMTGGFKFLTRPVAAVLGAIALIFGGILSYLSLPIAELPGIDLPTIVITGLLPGASPETMASAVATPIEKRVGLIAGLTELTSSNVAGATTIVLQFGPEREIVGALSDVQSAVNAAGSDLPKDMPGPPTIVKFNPALAPVIFLAATSESLPPGEVYENIDRIIAQPLAQLEGVSKVVIQGGQKTAVRIKVDPSRLASLGLGLNDVRIAIAAANGGGALGAIESGEKSFTLAADDQVFRAAFYKPLIITSRGDAVVRLSDVADVTDDVADERVAGWFNNRRALFVLVQREAGANIVATAERVNAMLPQLLRWLPPSIKVSVVADRTYKIKETIIESWKTMLVTSICVVGMIFLTLRDWRASIVPTVAIPISLLGTFIVMDWLDYSIDTISLTALTVCVGFVVDDAIVMIENIARFREAGFSRMEATIRGAREISFTIISITVSLVAALLPLILVPGVIGQFLREFSVTLCAAIVISGIVSLTLTPVMCANFLSLHQPTGDGLSRNWFLNLCERFGHWTYRVYERTLSLALTYSGTVLLTAIILTGVTVYLYIKVPKGFLPTQDTGIISGVTEGGQDLSFNAMCDRQLAVSRVVLQDTAVESVTSYIGTSTGTAAGTGRLFITLKPRAERDSMPEVIERLRAPLAALTGISTYLRSIDDVGVGAREGKGRFQFTLQADDWNSLERFYPRALETLKNLPQLRDVSSDQRSKGLQVMLRMDRDRASLLNVSARSIDDALYDSFGQRQIATVMRDFDQFQVVMEVGAVDRSDPTSLDRMFVRSDDGAQVPLRTVTTRENGTTALSIAHQGQFPAVTIAFNLAPGAALSEAVASIRTAIDALELPPGVRATFEGNARAFASSSGSEPWLILAAFLTIYIVLGILYESYIHPLTIISSLPPAGLGALLAALVCRIEFTLLSFVGLVLLLGIVKKNAILMIDVAIVRERRDGASPRDAIFYACLLRFRPIMMTTLTALIGALPLALDTGAGAELRRSFGIVVVGGLMVSQVLTLYTTPVIYLFMERLRQKRWRWTSRRTSLPREPASAAPR